MTHPQRRALFEAVLPFTPNKNFNVPGLVGAIDKVADLCNIPKDSPPPSSTPGRMRISQKGIDLIHSFETLKLKSYRDPGSSNGLPITCGWGTTVDENGKPIPLGVTWTKEKADRLFLRDIASREDALNRLLDGAPTTQNQFDALMSLGYNIGMDEDADTKAEGLGDSTLLRKHKAGDYAGAWAAFTSWAYNDGKLMRGLERRRKAERTLYAGG